MQVDSVRNPDGIWINTQCFREAANHFVKYGYYTADPWGSPAWFEYWQEEMPPTHIFMRAGGSFSLCCSYKICSSNVY